MISKRHPHPWVGAWIVVWMQMAASMEASMFSMFSMFNMHVRACVRMHVCVCVHGTPSHTLIPTPTPIHPSTTPPGGPPESVKIR